MQALIELIAGFLALLAAAALSQFGVDMETRKPTEREIHRTSDCPPPPSGQAVVRPSQRSC